MSEIDYDHSNGRQSTDSTMQLNDDLASLSDFSSSAPKKAAESVFSSMRSSIDGSASIINAFNILKQGLAVDEDATSNSSHPLGPNSIFGLTVGSDISRLRMHRGLKSQVTVNGGKSIVSSLIKPSKEDIPQILLTSLKNKVTSTELTNMLVKDTISEYKSFELGYKSLTEDMLSKLSELADLKLSSVPEIPIEVETDVDQIPAVFEDSDFRLDDPRIFRQVIENKRLLPSDDLGEDTSVHIANDTNVQERLSQYLDAVEVQLIQEISRKSDSFFNTLGEIEAVETKSKLSSDKLTEIKQKLGDIEEGQAMAGSNILDLLDERKSVNHLESSVLQIRAILSRYADARIHYKQLDNFNCLQDIFVIEDLISGTEFDDHEDSEAIHSYPKFQYPLVDLLKLPALATVQQELQDLKLSCALDYGEQFVQLLLEDLRSHYKSVPSQDTLNRIYVAVNRPQGSQETPSNKTYMDVSPHLKKQLEAFIQNLSKSGFITKAFSEFQNRSISEVKAIIRSNLPSGKLYAVSDGSLSTKDKLSVSENDALQSEASTSTNVSLSVNIKNLSTDEFAAMMTTIYVNLSECFRRLTIHQKLLLDLSLTSLSPSLFQSIDVMSLDITTSINKAIELSQIRLVKILNVRLEQIGDLSADQYLRLFLISSAYLLECESINPGFVSTSAGSSLTEWVKNHVGYFVHRFHSKSVKDLAINCDKETWREVTLPDKIAESQDILNSILGFSQYVYSGGKNGYDGHDWLEALNFYSDKSQTSDEQIESVKTFLEERLKIKDEKYLIPQLLQSVIENLRDYLKIMKVYPSRAASIRANITIFFKLMNSRISSAILNAGATRTAGLKHITTKHLALCIQTISFCIDLLTELQPIFADEKYDLRQNQTGSDDLTMEKVLGYYRDHHKDLHDKLVSIMHDRTLNHSLAVTKVDFSLPIKHPQQCHAYMETLVKETTTVSKVLTKYLPLTECSLILLQIFNNYKTLLVKCYCMDLPQFKDFNEKQNLLKDVDFFRVKLSELPGYGNSGQVIWENVNSLPTIEDTRMEEIMRSNIAKEMASSEAPSAKTSVGIVDSSNISTLSDVSAAIASEKEDEHQASDSASMDENKDPYPKSGEASQNDTYTDSMAEQNHKTKILEFGSSLDDQDARSSTSPETSKLVDERTDAIAEDRVQYNDDLNEAIADHLEKPEMEESSLSPAVSDSTAALHDMATSLSDPVPKISTEGDHNAPYEPDSSSKSIDNTTTLAGEDHTST